MSNELLSAYHEVIMNPYTEPYYRTRHEKTVYAANVVLSVLLERIPPIHSAVDVGCGVGTWLSVLREKGTTDIQGIDGEWVDPNLLAIPKNCFRQVDLSQPLVLPRRYDLAICLEVAEHLPGERAHQFGLSLTRLSDFILFSAAVPFQGGRNHFNEQWPRYWVQLFAALDYVAYDFVRANIWNDDNIPFFYRQNILFFASRTRQSDVVVDSRDSARPQMPLDLVHPDLYLAKVGRLHSVGGSFKALRRSLKSHLRKVLKRKS